jgi:hypothetical protein
MHGRRVRNVQDVRWKLAQKFAHVVTNLPLAALWEANRDLLPYAEPLTEVIRRRYRCDGQIALGHDSEARLIAFSD